MKLIKVTKIENFPQNFVFILDSGNNLDLWLISKQ